jgi:hypothetical protein
VDTKDITYESEVAAAPPAPTEKSPVRQNTTTVQMMAPLGRIMLTGMAAVVIPAIILMYFRQNAELKKSFADYALLEQTLQKVQQEKDVLRRAAAARSSSSLPAPTSASLLQPPVFIVHQLGEHDTLLGLGFKFCGVKPGEKEAELEFLDEVTKRNKSDGVARANDSRLLTMPTTTLHGKKVPLGEEGQFWRFPGTCRFPSLTYAK